jgi:DNA-binding helix-hairpin-helix protein with protein kinase domain
MPGYVAPELLMSMRASKVTSYINASPTFTPQTDLFALAIHVFRLLMNGVHPYNGIDVTQDSSSAVAGAGDEPVYKGRYCFAWNQKPKNRTIPPIDILPDIFKEYFKTAFISYENGRPTWSQWLYALDEYAKRLVQCRSNSLHWHHKDLSCCPWCEADDRDAKANSILHKPKFKVKRKSDREFARELYVQ